MALRINVINKSDEEVPINFTKKISELFFKYLSSLEVIPKKASFVTSIVYVNEPEILNYNKKYRNKNVSTDVLTFCTYEWTNPFARKFCLRERTKDLGDILISMTNVERNTIGRNVCAKEELARVVAHGILHLLKFVHQKEINENEEMFKIQEGFLNELRKRTVI